MCTTSIFNDFVDGQTSVFWRSECKTVDRSKCGDSTLERVFSSWVWTSILGVPGITTQTRTLQCSLATKAICHFSRSSRTKPRKGSTLSLMTAAIACISNSTRFESYSPTSKATVYTWSKTRTPATVPGLTSRRYVSPGRLWLSRETCPTLSTLGTLGVSTRQRTTGLTSSCWRDGVCSAHTSMTRSSSSIELTICPRHNRPSWGRCGWRQTKITLQTMSPRYRLWRGTRHRR
mmetsp:Transcript_14216/g.30866  ORF Transcript_14216/g.30866 Transcript_14216/m.30866 type:complete len:233 (+) Transcript_14216:88-786(+)